VLQPGQEQQHAGLVLVTDGQLEGWPFASIVCNNDEVLQSACMKAMELEPQCSRFYVSLHAGQVCCVLQCMCRATGKLIDHWIK
jgi:hypothetical protein